MLIGIHILLTYSCNFECDHCFLYCSPSSEGTFTIEGLKRLMRDVVELGGIEEIYFEGGEPFLHYALMLEGMKLARQSGFAAGIVTNSYWAVSPDTARLYLAPLAKLKIDDLSLSDDAFHYDDNAQNFARNAREASERLRLPVSVICITKPTIEMGESSPTKKGEPVVGGGVRFRGRAVDKLLGDLPRKKADCFCECPDEDLQNPERIHIDPYGNVLLCQGLSIGKIDENRSLAEVFRAYVPKRHPICGPLLAGGPAALAKKYGIADQESFVDACQSLFSCPQAIAFAFSAVSLPSPGLWNKGGHLIQGREERRQVYSASLPGR